jgi:hypothetical protein
VHFGVGPDFDVKVIAGLLTDESDQVTGVAKLAHARRTAAVAAGQVASQSHQSAYADGLHHRQFFLDGLAAGTDARKMWRAVKAFGDDGLHCTQSSVLRAATSTVGHRAKLRLQRIKLLAHGGQLDNPFRRFGWEKFEAQWELLRCISDHEASSTNRA